MLVEDDETITEDYKKGLLQSLKDATREEFNNYLYSDKNIRAMEQMSTEELGEIYVALSNLLLPIDWNWTNWFFDLYYERKYSIKTEWTNAMAVAKSEKKNGFSYETIRDKQIRINERLRKL